MPAPKEFRVEGTVLYYDAKNGFGRVKLADGREAKLDRNVIEAARFEEGPAETPGLPVIVDLRTTKGDKLVVSRIRRLGEQIWRPLPGPRRPFLEPGAQAVGRLERDTWVEKGGYGFVEVISVSGHTHIFLHVSLIPEDLLEAVMRREKFVFVVQAARKGRIQAGVLRLATE